MEALVELSNKLLNYCNLSFKRYIAGEIDWSDRLIGIMGMRGAGKTTLMLQHLKENYGTGGKALYISLDNVYFSRNSLLDLAGDFAKKGGEALYVDEVHKYPDWSVEIKNIYDHYPELKIVFSGSSILELYKGHGDLSRRLSSYTMPSMSFREFIELEHQIKLPAFTLKDVLTKHTEICHFICSKIKPIAFFVDYLEFGSLPFYLDNRSRYHERLHNVINLTLEYDLPSVTPTDYAHIIKIKMLLKIISEQVPYKPNITKLAAQTGIDRKTVLKYLDLLARSGLTMQLSTASKSDSVFTKPQKIYLGNPNFMYALCDEKPNAGTLRETFFCNQVSVKNQVNTSEASDFLVGNTYTFEIGGKNKDTRQLKGIEKAYVAADNLEYGFGNHIPLWLFGFLY